MGDDNGYCDVLICWGVDLTSIDKLHVRCKANLPCFPACLLLFGCPYVVLAERTVGSIDCMILMNTCLCDANTSRGNDLQSMHHLIALLHLLGLACLDWSLYTDSLEWQGRNCQRLPRRVLPAHFQLAASANHLSVPDSGRSRTSPWRKPKDIAMVTALALIAIPLAYYTGELVSGPTTVGS